MKNWTVPDIEDLLGIQGGAKKSGHYVIVLEKAGGVHPTKWVPWTPVKGDPKNLTMGPGIGKNI